MSIFLPALLTYGLIGFGLYWIIRLAVRHALRDHDQERASSHGSQQY